MNWDETDEARVGRQQRRQSHFLESYLLNPGPITLVGCLRKSVRKGLRGLLVGDDLYWWDADFATHSDARRWLGVEGDRSRQFDSDATVFDVELYFDSDGDVVASSPGEIGTGIQGVLNHRTLKSAWRNGVLLVE